MSPDGAPTGPPTETDDRPIGELVFDVSEQISNLIRDEVELAKAEISEKIAKILRGSAVGIAAGVFVLLGLVMLMHAFAWFLNDLFFGDTFWLGFLIEAALFFLIAVVAGLFAYRSVKAGSPPTPDMAIEEGRRIKQTLDSSTEPGSETR
jgi:uncharacterized membrane protein YqjE